MPLVIVSGLPSSGKTRRVAQLVEFIKTSYGRDAQVWKKGSFELAYLLLRVFSRTTATCSHCTTLQRRSLAMTSVQFRRMSATPPPEKRR